jgi:hypothetical protein
MCQSLHEPARSAVPRFGTTRLASREAFTQAASAGDLDALVAMLAEDAVLVTDGGAEGRRAAGIRNLQAPLQGARRIAAFISATARSIDLVSEIHTLKWPAGSCFLPRGFAVRRAPARYHRGSYPSCVFSCGSRTTALYRLADGVMPPPISLPLKRGEPPAALED